jgi:ATP-dependent helicase/DNAse subunit B
MFLYLKSLIDEKSEKFRDSIGVGKSGRAIPAGVIYLKTAVSDVRIDTPDDKLAEEAVKAEQGREGMILNDEKAINAMKLKYTPVFSSKTPDKISAEKNNYLFDEESFGEIMKTVEKSVTEVANNLRDGKIEAAPKRNKKSDALPCEYCEFKPICRSAAKK